MGPQCNNHRLYVKGLASSDVKVNVQDKMVTRGGIGSQLTLSARLADRPLRPFDRKTASRFSFLVKALSGSIPRKNQITW